MSVADWLLIGFVVVPLAVIVCALVLAVFGVVVSVFRICVCRHRALSTGHQGGA